MNIVALYPGMTPYVDDYWWVWLEMAARGHSVTLISSSSSSLKGVGRTAGVMPRVTLVDGIRLCHLGADEHLWESQSWVPLRRELASWAADAQVVVASHHTTVSCAAEIARGRPVVTILESWADDFYMSSRRRAAALWPVAKVQSALCRGAVASRSQRIVTCDPRASRLSDARTVQIDWPSGPVVRGGRLASRGHAGVFVGSLASFKNSRALLGAVPSLMKSGLDEFIIVGPEIDVSVLAPLRAKLGKRLIYSPSMKREEALKCIASARVALSPARWGGWGFVTDAWGAGTPVLALHDHMGFEDFVDGILVRGRGLANACSQVLDSAVGEAVAAAGRLRFESRHSPSVVCEALEAELAMAETKAAVG